ncbi:MAG: iron-sulfur cluster insertion protein ErpA [Chloroflexi bacterium]|nr:iron-sulfur cluster insertion protein ErpA [Chloroflexota bacterium]
MSTLELEQVVNLTPAASLRVKSLLNEKGLQGYGLRVFVGGGGCGGLQYGMAFENEEQEGDFVMNFDGVKVMVDSMSSQYLMGANVDYIDNIMGGGFKIDNPNAVSTCGCGHSFKSSEQSAGASSEAGCGCH